MNRRDALQAVSEGTVTARIQNAAGSRPLFEPKEYTVSMGYLQRTGLVYLTRVPGLNGRASYSIHLTEAGEHVLRQLSA